MKKTGFAILSCLVSVAVMVSAVFIAANAPSTQEFANATNPEYSLKFDSNKNKLHQHSGNTAYDGETMVQTELGSNICVSYYQVKGVATTWQVLGANGYFLNTDPLHGLQSISLTFKTDNADFEIQYSHDMQFGSSKSFISSASATTLFDFAEQRPNYFKVVNMSGSNLNISSVVCTYECAAVTAMMNVQSTDESKGTVQGSGLKEAGQSVAIQANPLEGYSFVCWKEYSPCDESNACDISSRLGDVISSENPYIFSMPNRNLYYAAEFALGSYTLTVACDSEERGLAYIDIDGDRLISKSLLFNATVNIVASSKEGAAFLGWYEGQELISREAQYSITIPARNLSLTAKFDWTPYLVTVDTNDDNMGSVNGAGLYTFDQRVRLEAIPAEHCSFFGWYEGEKLLSQDAHYAFDMPAYSMNLSARFVQNYVLNVVSEDESKGLVFASNAEFGAGLTVSVSSVAKEGYGLALWYDDDLNEVSYDPEFTLVMPERDYTLYASFTTGHKLSLRTLSGGDAIFRGEGWYRAGANVRLVADVDSTDLVFWFDDEQKIVSKESTHIVTMPDNDCEFGVSVYCPAEDIKEKILSPKFDSDGQTVTYGVYPQTHVSDSALVERLEQLNSDGLVSDSGIVVNNGEYYVKREVRWCSDGSTQYYFSDGSPIQNDLETWFKCEPIEWVVLEKTDRKCFVLSKRRIAYGMMTQLERNGTYGDSYFRRNLLEGESSFFAEAFQFNSSYLRTMNVSNSKVDLQGIDKGASIWLSAEEQQSTNDVVTVLSVQDYLNPKYGFSEKTRNDEKRMFEYSDYALAMMSRQKNAINWCLTRSPTYSGQWAALDALSGSLLEFMPTQQSAKNLMLQPVIELRLE